MNFADAEMDSGWVQDIDRSNSQPSLRCAVGRPHMYEVSGLRNHLLPWNKVLTKAGDANKKRWRIILKILFHWPNGKPVAAATKSASNRSFTNIVNLFSCLLFFLFAKFSIWGSKSAPQKLMTKARQLGWNVQSEQLITNFCNDMSHNFFQIRAQEIAIPTRSNAGCQLHKRENC